MKSLISHMRDPIARSTISAASLPGQHPFVQAGLQPIARMPESHVRGPGRQTVNLPLSPKLADADVERVIEALSVAIGIN